MNQLPLRINRSRPHEHPDFDVLGRFPRSRRPVLCRLFFPLQKCVWATKPGVSSGALQSKSGGSRCALAVYRKSSAKPRRVVARSVLSLLSKRCMSFTKFYKLMQAHGARDVAARIMPAGGRHTQGAQTVRGWQDATWMIE